ncbi:hypothetical protein COHA_010118 [Chlorella ohadii]|uniref:Uncharacterized protein n=1 Tax=Chlorella ohadii TaxID=2649997 RepID=A0AAD5DGZ5_9CHLO|nr:hypothetical protein COHA_010118 [Chlorella ohadii]
MPGRTSAALLKCLIAAALLGAALAAFDTDCTYPAEWVNNDKRIEGTSAPLSGCQVDLLNMAAADDILLGGKGSATIIGVPAGGDSGGCDGGGKCMKWCQALCCMSPGCVYASIKREEKTVDYVVYKETSTYYYCRMYSSGQLKDSDSQSTCTKKGSNYCDELAYESFKLDLASYQTVVAAGAYATCPARRSLLGVAQAKHWNRNPFRHFKMPVQIPTPKEIVRKVNLGYMPFVRFKENVILQARNNTLPPTIQGSGTCRFCQA